MKFKRLLKVVSRIFIFIAQVLVIMWLWHSYANPIFTGNFIITSQPSGAKVWIDDQEKGVTPLIISRVDFAKHTIRVAKDGFKNVQETRWAPLFQTKSLDYRLIQPMGYITINSDPKGADVLIDDKKIGQTPLEGMPVSVGKKAKVIIQKEGYRSVSKEIDFGLGSKETLSFTLDPWRTVAIEDGDVIIMNADGSNKQKITSHRKATDYAYIYSANTKIVYAQAQTQKKKVKDAAGTDTEVEATVDYLYTIDADGKNDHQLLPDPVTSLQKLPSQDAIAYSNVDIVDANTVNSRHDLLMLDLTDVSVKPKEIISAKSVNGQIPKYVFSPDGNKVAVAYPSKLEIVGLGDKTKSQTLSYPIVNIGNWSRLPSIYWTPDSKWLYADPYFSTQYTTESDKKTYAKDYKDESINVYKINVDKGKSELVFSAALGSPNYAIPISASPDGKYILVAAIKKEKRASSWEANKSDVVRILYDTGTKEETVVLPEVADGDVISDVTWRQNMAYLSAYNQTTVSVYQLDSQSKQSSRLTSLSDAREGAFTVAPVGQKYFFSFVSSQYDAASKKTIPAGKLFELQAGDKNSKLLDSLNSLADFGF